MLPSSPQPPKSPEKSHPGMRFAALPAFNSTWLPDSICRPVPLLTGNHKILCQGCEIISVEPVCQGFPYGKITHNKVVIFQYIMDVT
jgi:hypothetical protein